MKNLLAILCVVTPLTSFAASEKPVLASLSALEMAGAKILARDPEIDVGYARITPKQEAKISQLMHEAGKCGGFEVLPENSLKAGQNILSELAARVKHDRALEKSRARMKLELNPALVAALAELQAENVHQHVAWLASFPSRYHLLPDPNVHVKALEAKLREMLKNYSGAWSVEQISHGRTRQNSLRLRLEGKTRPSEIIVLGGHLDSINPYERDNAPGADDNASGSGALLEALRVFAAKGPAERSIEFFWYAGEEGGLLGSAEIARKYKEQSKNVVAVLQLDMTMFPGSGEFVISSMTDFTSAWLRSYLVAANEAYIGARVVESKCGYGCSDHASWYRFGYPTLMPHEATFDDGNHNIHTAKDVIDSTMSFRHALVFSKIALIMAMDLGNSTATAPKP